MIVVPPLDAKRFSRFAAPPWNEDSEPWLELDPQLPPNHLAREIRDAMTHLDLTPLDLTYGRQGKAAHPPDLMLAMVLFEQRRGRNSLSMSYCTIFWLSIDP